MPVDSLARTLELDGCPIPRSSLQSRRPCWRVQTLQGARPVRCWVPCRVAPPAAADAGRPGPAAGQDMAALKVVVSAGGTRERLDPVRFIGNASSGLMGWALARAAVLRGAEGKLVAANGRSG